MATTEVYIDIAIEGNWVGRLVFEVLFHWSQSAYSTLSATLADTVQCNPHHRLSRRASLCEVSMRVDHPLLSCAQGHPLHHHPAERETTERYS